MKTSHPTAIKLVERIINKIPKTSSGTYNKMDPTSWEKGELGLYSTKLSYHDSTWAIDLTVETLSGKEYSLRFFPPCMGAEGYIETETPRLLIDLKHLEDTVNDFVKADQDRWIDPAGGVHYGHEDDPAAMYE